MQANKRQSGWKRYVSLLIFVLLIAPAGLVFAGVAEDSAQGVALYKVKRYEDALPYLQKAAEGGDTTAQLYLGNMYREGLGVEPDYEKAAQWFLKAAEQNHPPAQTLVGVMYYKGMGVEQSFPEAKKWLEKASANGERDAQSFLGLISLDNSEERNPAKAIALLTKAADQNEPLAQTVLGIMYIQGKYVKQDYAKAEALLTKGAEAGNPDAATFLGNMYYRGQGVKKNKEKAVYWLEKSAIRGDVDAQELLYRIHHAKPGEFDD